ncbi:MAG TPA: hypothetical protein VN697_02815 [Tepidiformaceae bacterium]|nr:hypothetical protein [Sphingomicrobium sp.]HXU22942.1 hypothetical protein [Tepidiformaceae bacterium]
MQKFTIKNLAIREISSVDRPAQQGAVAVIMKSAERDVEIRKNAGEVAAGQKPGFTVTDFEDAMLRRADELARETSATPEQALAKGLSTDTTLMDLAHAGEVARVAEYGQRVRKRVAA